MRSIFKIAIACGVMFVVGFVISVGVSRPASAQGGIVCDFGPKRYKDCCKQSYREHRKLSASKRADDIDACMDAKSAAKKKPVKDTKEAAPTDKAKDSSKEDSKKDDSKDEPTKPVEEKKKD
jgi:hypothetical protein